MQIAFISKKSDLLFGGVKSFLYLCKQNRKSLKRKNMKTNYEIRYAAHPEDAKHYDTQRLRRDFLIEKVFGEEIGRAHV